MAVRAGIEFHNPHNAQRRLTAECGMVAKVEGNCTIAATIAYCK